jgi:hypothetical protein
MCPIKQAEAPKIELIRVIFKDAAGNDVDILVPRR